MVDDMLILIFACRATTLQMAEKALTEYDSRRTVDGEETNMSGAH